MARRPTAAAVVVAAVVAVLVTVDVLVGGPLSRLDPAVAELFWAAGVREQRPGSPARVFFGVLADFGSWLPVLAVVLPWLALVCRRHRTAWPLARLAVLGALVIGAVLAVKAGASRPPPASIVLPLESGRSYPSGHMVTAVALWGLLAATVIEYGRSLPERRVAVTLAWLGPLLAMIGMLVLDYHWLSDLVGGAAIGVVLLGVLRGLDRPALRHWVRARAGGGPPAGGAAGAGGGARRGLATGAEPGGG